MKSIATANETAILLLGCNHDTSKAVKLSNGVPGRTTLRASTMEWNDKLTKGSCNSKQVRIVKK
jgi:hypothetical protein